MMIPTVIDTNKIKRSDIKDLLIHDKGIISVHLHYADQQFTLSGDAAIAFIKRVYE